MMPFKTIPELVDDIRRSEEQVVRLKDLLGKCGGLASENISRDIAFFNAQVCAMKEQLKHKNLAKPLLTDNLLLISKANNHNDKTCVLLTMRLQSLEDKDVPIATLVRFSPEEYKKEVEAQKQRQVDIDNLNHLIIDFMATNKHNNDMMNENRKLNLSVEIISTGSDHAELHKVI